MSDEITQGEIMKERLREVFDYKEGNLVRKTTGKIVGTLRADNYIQIGLDYKIYLAHRLIWIYHNGGIPEDLEIDHIDRDKSNNCLGNLRLVTKSQNQFNTNAKGYCFSKRDNKWRAQIRREGKVTFIGLFKTEEEARQAYLKKKEEMHKI